MISKGGALGLILATVLVLALAPSVGCVGGDEDSNLPGSLVILRSVSPGGKHSIEVTVDPLPLEDRFTVTAELAGHDGDFGLMSEVRLPSVRADRFVVWVDESTLVWDARVVVNLSTGEQRDLTVPGGGTLLDYDYSPALNGFAYLIVENGNLNIWVAPVDGSAAWLLFSEQIRALKGEAAGNISWGKDNAYFTLQRGAGSDIVCLPSGGGKLTTVVERASNPSASPDGRYLSYQHLGANGAAIAVTDLATGDIVAEGLPWGVGVWSADSCLLAIQTNEQVAVYAMPEGIEVLESDATGVPVLSRFTDQCLTYADIIQSGVISSVTIVERSITSGP